MTVFGSVALHNPRVVYQSKAESAKHKFKYVFVACDEFPEGKWIPRYVIDPKDFGHLWRAYYKKREALTELRVLRWWYEGTISGNMQVPKIERTEPDLIPCRVKDRVGQWQSPRSGGVGRLVSAVKNGNAGCDRANRTSLEFKFYRRKGV